MKPVQIVLATYNSVKYLDRMLASIEVQDCDDWLLIARDDGSTDGTAERLVHWQCRLGERMRLILNPSGVNLGITGNFTLLLQEVTSPYFMIADGDDRWHSDKVRLSLVEIRELEKRVGANRPLLVHTDMRIIDGEDRAVSPSAWRYAGVRPRFGYALIEMIFSNVVCGPSVVGNRALRDRALPIPAGAAVEDWWLALVAAAFGVVSPLERQTLDYRRHGHNASELPRVIWLTRLSALVGPSTMRRRLYRLIVARQPIAKAFLDRYAEELHPADQAALTAWLQLREAAWWRRRVQIVQHRLWFNSLAVNFAYLLFV